PSCPTAPVRTGRTRAAPRGTTSPASASWASSRAPWPTRCPRPWPGIWPAGRPTRGTPAGTASWSWLASARDEARESGGGGRGDRAPRDRHADGAADEAAQGADAQADPEVVDAGGQRFGVAGNGRLIDLLGRRGDGAARQGDRAHEHPAQH